LVSKEFHKKTPFGPKKTPQKTLFKKIFKFFLYFLSPEALSVTDGEGGECMDPGENGAILDAGGVGGPGPPVGEKNGQLALDSGGG
jgi:hypothetical protein